MIIYPAIDIKDGKCVRLTRGMFNDVTVYSDTPSKVAQAFVSGGAKFIHVVDLSGAKEGTRQNASVISEIVKSVGDAHVQLGGGIRDMKGIDDALSLGVFRVIIGTAATENPDFIKEAAKKYGDKIVVGIDAKNGMAATHGWEKVSNISAIDLAKTIEFSGVKTIIYTDIATDGMLSGPNLTAMNEMANSVTIDVIASGGISCMADIDSLKDTGVSGVIVGKAIYEHRVTLNQLFDGR